MLLYLAENIVICLLAALTVRLLVSTHDEPEGAVKTRSGALKTYFMIAGGFTFTALVITVGVVMVNAQHAPRWNELATGLALMAAFQVIGFIWTLRTTRSMTLYEGENLLASTLGRVFLLAFGVWAGLFLFFVFRSFFIPFVILKTIADLWSLQPALLKRRLARV